MRKFFTCKLFPTVFTLIALAGCTGSETLPTQPGTYLNDLWSYDLVNNQWVPVSSADPLLPLPSARRDHTAVAETTNNKMYVFGGFNGTYLNDLWRTDFGSSSNWTKIEPALQDDPWPSARRGHSAVEYNGKIYIFGGFNGALLNDIWEYNPSIADKPWTVRTYDAAKDTTNWPPARRFHTAVVYNNTMYIFGGDNGAYLNDVWAFDLSAGLASGVWTQKTPAGDLPSRRNGHSAVVDDSGKMYIFGGGTFNGVLNDVWECNLALTDISCQDKTPTTGTMPTARGVHSAVMLGTTEMFVFGGYDTAASDELWKFNISSPAWESITVTPGPTARYAHSAVVDTSTNTMYIFGGYGPPTQ